MPITRCTAILRSQADRSVCSQLDRLWWSWQERDIKNRHREYQAVAKEGTQDAVSLRDMVELTGLAPPLMTYEVMDTQSGVLCYRY